MRLGLRIATAVTLVGFLGLAMVGADDKPKYAIKDVMKKAMKGGLCGKCAKGEASEAEKKELVEMFEALCKCKPPQGEEAEDDEESEQQQGVSLDQLLQLVAMATQPGSPPPWSKAWRRS